jgi:hypothetical protein
VNEKEKAVLAQTLPSNTILAVLATTAMLAIF